MAAVRVMVGGWEVGMGSEVDLEMVAVLKVGQVRVVVLVVKVAGRVMRE